METVPFGKLDFKVSRISFGGGAVSGEGGGYGFGAIDEKAAAGLLRAAYDAGINLFDTAPIYGYGMSERRIGKAFAGMRDRVFIVSKCGVDWDQDKTPRIDNDPAVVRRMLEQSLRDLATDYIDLYLIHWPDKKVDVRRTMEVLAQARKDGKIRAIGLSNFYDPAEIRKAAEIERVDVVQTEFNIFHTQARDELLPFLKSEEMGYMSWGTFDKGILTGRVTRERKFEHNDFRQVDWGRWQAGEAKLRAMDRIAPLLRDRGLDGRRLAFGFVFAHPEASTAICGVKSPEQLATALEALENRAPRGVVDEAVRIAAEEAAK
ncbi:MAG: aldo/keto reductase [Elusimicrobiota bacterium]